MKKLLWGVLIVLTITIFFLYNYGIYVESRTEKKIFDSHSYIIGTILDLSCANDIVVHKNIDFEYNTILLTVTSTCGSCYIKLSQIDALVKKDSRFKNVNVLIVVEGDYENEKIISVIEQYGFNYIVDKGNYILKNNRYFSMNQMYVIDSKNEVLLVGDLFESMTMRRIFAKYIINYER